MAKVQDTIPLASNTAPLTVGQTVAQETQKKRVANRRKKVTLTPDSKRPGRAPGTSYAAKTLKLIFPAASTLGDDGEFTQVREFASELSRHISQASVVAVGIERSEFVVTLVLRGSKDDSDDKLLSDFFEQLEQFYGVNSLLPEGLPAGVPRYEYRIGDDFIAEKGAFA